MSEENKHTQEIDLMVINNSLITPKKFQEISEHFLSLDNCVATLQEEAISVDVNGATNDIFLTFKKDGFDMALVTSEVQKFLGNSFALIPLIPFSPANQMLDSLGLPPLGNPIRESLERVAN